MVTATFPGAFSISACFCVAPFLVLLGGMTDRGRHRLSLVLALIGALAILAHVSNQFRIAGMSGNLPAFEKSRPNIEDWPRHHHVSGSIG